MIWPRLRSAAILPIGGWVMSVALMLVAASLPARAQAAAQTIYGVTSLEVAQPATGQAVVLLKQYRDAARRESGNLAVELLQEVGAPNRFLVYETWADQAAYDRNEKAASSAELSDKLKPIAGAPYDRRDYHVVDVAPALPASSAGSVYMQVHLDVFPPGLTPALAAVKQVAEASRKGEGNLRYDVVQSVKPPLSHMTLFAAWQSRKQFDEYEMSGYGRRFRDAVGPLLGSPFDDRLYVPVD